MEKFSFLRGISTIGITPRKNSVLDEYMRSNDYLDMMSDWQSVGNDMRWVIGKWKK